MTTERQRLGTYGEHLAAQHLVRAGMVVLDRNWRGVGGELDLVLRDGRTLVICEVKTRSSTAFGSPLEGVTATKAARLRRLAGQWLEAHDLRVQDIRIDLVGVLRTARGSEIEHVAGVC
jgi:putative endonuclease